MNQENEKRQLAGADARPDLQRAAESVVLELAHILADYRDAFVISGGLALRLLFPSHEMSHSVTITASYEPEAEPFERFTKDVDLILNVHWLDEAFDDQIPSIREVLMESNYHQEQRKHYWIRRVNLPGFAAPQDVPVEFLAPEHLTHRQDGAAVLERVVTLQDVKPAPLYGIDLVLIQPQTVMLSGTTPSGLHLKNVPVQVVDLAMLILVKAIAFKDRLRKHGNDPEGDKHLSHAAKHAYDISECLRRYAGNMPALADRLTPLWLAMAGPEQALIDDALECLRTHFATPGAEGPRRMVQEEYYQFHSDNDKMVAQIQTARRVERLLRLLDERMEAEL